MWGSIGVVILLIIIISKMERKLVIWESSSKGIGTTYTTSTWAFGLFSMRDTAKSSDLRPPSVASTAARILFTDI